MKKKELTKEALIALWNNACKKSKEEKDFSIIGSDESPYYMLNIEDSISIALSATQGLNKNYTYKISVVFGDFVEYLNFDLDMSEFTSLVELFTKSQNNSINKKIESIVKTNEERFFEIITDCQI
jgi:hypothetical protein